MEMNLFEMITPCCEGVKRVVAQWFKITKKSPNANFSRKLNVSKSHKNKK